MHAREDRIHARENTAITAVLLLWDRILHISKRPFIAIQFLLLLVS